MGPVSVVVYDGDTSLDRSIILGGRTGFLRKLHDSFTDDDGTAINAFAIMGPYKPGGQLGITMQPLPGSDIRNGLMEGIDIILGEVPPGFTNANWNCIVTIQSDHDAIAALLSPRYARSKTFTTPGRQTRWLMRQHGVALYVKVSNVDGSFFSFEPQPRG